MSSAENFTQNAKLGRGSMVGTRSYSTYTNSNNALFINVTNFSILQHRCDIIDFGQTLLYKMCIALSDRQNQYIVANFTSFYNVQKLKFYHGDYKTLLLRRL